MSEPSSVLCIWTLYESPTDFAPGTFVARKWEIGSSGVQPTTEVIATTSLEGLRSDMEMRGLYRLQRFDNDDPCIIETWL